MVLTREDPARTVGADAPPPPATGRLPPSRAWPARTRHAHRRNEGVALVNHTPEHSTAPVSGDGAPRSVANPRRTQLDANGRPTSAQNASLPQQD